MRLNASKIIHCFFLFISFLLGVGCIVLQAQSSFPDRLRFDSYTINEGLSESVVMAIAEDKYGEMCIGTEKGLDIFNGYDFENHNQINNYDLSEVSSITPLPNDFLLIVTNKPKSFLFNPADRSFQSTDSIIKQMGLPKPYNIYCALATNDGNIWYGTDSGVLVVDFFDLGLYGKPKISFHPIPYSSEITSLAEDDGHRIWALSDWNKIFILDDKKGNTLYQVDTTPMQEEGESNLVLYSDRDKHIWIGSRVGVFAFKGIKNQLPLFQQLKLFVAGKDYSDCQVNCLYKDKSGKMWIGTSGDGIFLYNSKDHATDHFVESPFYPKSLNSNTIFCITQDSHQRIWIGTFGGINKYDPNAHKFSLYDHDPVEPGKRLSMIFGMVQADSQNLIVVSNDKPYLVNTNTSKITEINSHSPTKGKEAYRLLYPGVHDTIWAPSSLGLRIISKEHGQFVCDKPNIPALKSIEDMPVSAVLAEGDSLVWFGLSEGLFLWNRKVNKLSHIFPIEGKRSPYYDHYVKCMVEDQYGDYWMGTQNGLIRYNRSTQKVTRFLTRKTNDNNPPLYIYDLLIDKNILWGATSNAGLIKFNVKTHAYKRLTTDDGLPDNTVWACAMDDRHHLWLSTDKGICEFYPDQNNFRYFTVEDGLQSDEFNQGSVLKITNGDIFFGGIYGMNRIIPGTIAYDTSSIPIVVSKMNIYAKEQNNIFFPGDSDHFIFPYQENTIVVQFNALNYIQPKLNNYRYKLIKAGFPEKKADRQNISGWPQFSYSQFMNNTWIEAGNSNSLTFSHIAPGSYILAIETMNGSNVWNKNPNLLYITILPPFWQTSWFRMMLILLFLFLVYAIFRWRLRAEKKSNRQKIEKSALTQKVMQLEKMALQAQMNPHFIFNSLNSIKAYILSAESDQAIDYLNDFASLIRKVLQNSKKETIPLSEELEAIERYVKLEERRLKKKLWLTISKEDNLSLPDILVPPLIIQPLVENAIWHGIRPQAKEGIIEIVIKKANHCLEVTITDNGIGRELAAKYRRTNYNLQSMGASITEERLSHFNGSEIENLVYEDLPDHTGTKVKLSINLENN